MVYLSQFPVPTEGVQCVQNCVEAIIDQDSSGKGTLYITEQIISWINGSSGEGFNIPYNKMALHAISRDSNVHSSDCLYIMINGQLVSDEEGSEEDLNQDCSEDITEIRFVPEESESLNTMYQSIQQCTLLHPDPSSDMSEEDPDDLFEGHEEEDGGGDHGLIDDDDVDSDDEERIRQFERLQVHFGANNSSQNNGNGESNEQQPFNPDQFADAEDDD